MANNLIGGDRLVGKALVYERLAGSGLTSPPVYGAGVISIWILDSDILPQPADVVGVWKNDDFWQNNNVWYS